jgi:hypothetical protein
MKSFMICSVTKYVLLWGDEIKVNEIGGARGTHAGDDRFSGKT